MRSATLKTALAAAALFAVNAYVVHELFFAGFINQMASIDGAHMGVPRYLSQHWTDLGWFPLWYAGMPFQNTYPPLLRILAALVINISGAAPVVAYHFVTATLYCLGPVTLFWMALRLSGSRLFSFLAGLFYSLFSPSVLLDPSILRDVGGLFYPRRVETLLVYGDGPHISALTLVPLAIVALDVALAKRRPFFHILAALAMGAAAMTNWLGGVAVAMAVIAYLLARPSTSGPAAGRAWLTALAIGAYAYLLFLPWFPPSTLHAISANSQNNGEFPMTTQHFKYLGLGLIALVLLRAASERWKLSTPVRFALFFTLPPVAILLASLWFRISIMPQPTRYQLEAEMGLALLAIFACRPLAAHMGRREAAVALLGVFLFCWMQARHYHYYARYLDGPIDVRKTVEYEAAQWFDRNLKGQRVFAPGSVGFWLPTFNDTPQLSGDFDQGLVNDLLPAVVYQVYTGDNAGAREDEVGTLWLKSFGVRAVMVGGPHSRESYHPFHNPHKFAATLRELWRDGDDVIYEVSRSRSLAHVMRPQDLAPRKPTGGLDVDPLRPYVAALDNPASDAAFRWLGSSRAEIDANPAPGQVISVQVNWHPGWHARVNGRSCAIHRDRLGLIVVEPACQGPCKVELHFDGGTEMWIARILSWLAILGGIAWLYRGSRST